MPRDRRFWRNVAIVTVAHLAIVLALARGSRDVARPNLETVVWMNTQAPAVVEAETQPSPTPREIEKREEVEVAAAAKSEIQLPSPSPTPTAAPKPTPSPTAKSTPKPSGTPTVKPTAKPAPKKSVEPKATPKPAKEKDEVEKKPASPRKATSPASNPDPSQTGTPGKGSGNKATQPSELAWYGTMLHDRFHKAWEQPKSIVATGVKLSTIVKIRIEKDGRVSKFAIVRPSGNVVVDESVAAIVQRVTEVDPLPDGLTKGAYYEVKIDFELNAEK
ncbi:MAG TPA: TonB family protein [Chthoniobacterales bacterium]